MHKVAIIGSGPAGYTAAIYAARANLAPILFTGAQAGGQLTTTTEVENFPGFPDGIMGPELMSRMEQQATRFGTTVRMGCTVTRVERLDDGFRLHFDDMYQGSKGTEEFRTVIVATGASAKYLGLPGEEEFFPPKGTRTGLTACAVCDGALPAYRNQAVAVIGGGDSACEEATFMTKFASKVYLVHRRDTLRASAIMAERALANPKIEPVWNTVPLGYEVDAKGHMDGLRVQDAGGGNERVLKVRGVFMAIGHKPNTDFLRGSGVEFDGAGYIVVSGGCRTKVPGLFAAGDVRDTVYRQAVTAAGMGCMAALEAERFLESGAFAAHEAGAHGH